MTKRQALRNLARAQESLAGLARASVLKAAQRDAFALDAADQGATYREIETATGLSTARVTQILRRARAGLRKESPE